MYNKTISGFDRLTHDIKNYPDLGQSYPPQPSASADNIEFGLDNSLYYAQPHPIIVYYMYHSY